MSFITLIGFIIIGNNLVDSQAVYSSGGCIYDSINMIRNCSGNTTSMQHSTIARNCDGRSYNDESVVIRGQQIETDIYGSSRFCEGDISGRTSTIYTSPRVNDHKIGGLSAVYLKGRSRSFINGTWISDRGRVTMTPGRNRFSFSGLPPATGEVFPQCPRNADGFISQNCGWYTQDQKQRITWSCSNGQFILENSGVRTTYSSTDGICFDQGGYGASLAIRLGANSSIMMLILVIISLQI